MPWNHWQCQRRGTTTTHKKRPHHGDTSWVLKKTTVRVWEADKRAAVHYNKWRIRPEEEKEHTYCSNVSENNHHIRMCLNLSDHNNNQNILSGYIYQQKVRTIVKLYLFRDGLLSLHRSASTFIQFNTWLLHKPPFLYCSVLIFHLYTSIMLLTSIKPQLCTAHRWAAGRTGFFQGHLHAVYKGRREIYTFPSPAMIFPVEMGIHIPASNHYPTSQTL